MSIVAETFKDSKLPIIIKLPVTLRQIVYICMTQQSVYICMTAISPNYLFANLLVACHKSTFDICPWSLIRMLTVQN